MDADPGMTRWALLLLVPLAGCFGTPDVPEDATVATDGDITISGWTEMRGGRIQFHGLAQNDGHKELDIRTGCGQPWRSILTGPDGRVDYVEVQEPSGCAAYWDVLRPGGHIEFLHSWDFRGHDPVTGKSWTLPGGEYLWRLQFWLRDDLTFVETRIPIEVPCSDRNPCNSLTGVELTLRLEEGGHQVNATLENRGDQTYALHEGCGEPWNLQLFHDGEPVTYSDLVTCLGFSTVDFGPGERRTFEYTWNGTFFDDGWHEAPSGSYTWRIQASVGGEQGPLVAAQEFVRP